jgi:signal peptidase I
MNLRQFSMALMISALPLVVSAGSSTISLNKGDFVSAEKISRNGETLVSVKLSKSGKAKFKKLNQL